MKAEDLPTGADQSDGKQDGHECAADAYIVSINRRLACALINLGNYDAEKCIETLSTLPKDQFETYWVLVQLGRAFYESAQYHAVRILVETFDKILGRKGIETVVSHRANSPRSDRYLLDNTLASQNDDRVERTIDQSLVDRRLLSSCLVRRRK
jgi:hypothetical protein